jgi:hypothetical protein
MRSAKILALALLVPTLRAQPISAFGTFVPLGLPSRVPRAFAAADRLTLLLSHQSHDRNREPVRVWHVDRDELDTRLLESKKEVRVAAQSIEFGDDNETVQP